MSYGILYGNEYLYRAINSSSTKIELLISSKSTFTGDFFTVKYDQFILNTETFEEIFGDNYISIHIMIDTLKEINHNLMIIIDITLLDDEVHEVFMDVFETKVITYVDKKRQNENFVEETINTTETDLSISPPNIRGQIGFRSPLKFKDHDGLRSPSSFKEESRFRSPFKEELELVSSSKDEIKEGMEVKDVEIVNWMHYVDKHLVDSWNYINNPFIIKDIVSFKKFLSINNINKQSDLQNVDPDKLEIIASKFKSRGEILFRRSMMEVIFGINMIQKLKNDLN